MLGVLTGQIIADALILDGFVLPTETNIAIGMQGSHVLGELVYGHGCADLIADLHGHFPVHLRGIRVVWRIVQIVVGRMEALSAEKSEEGYQVLQRSGKEKTLFKY